MGADTMSALEEKLRTYEDELMRLRIENEQLRQSSQAFGELAERLSVALRTATRKTAAGGSGRRQAARSRGILELPGCLPLERVALCGRIGRRELSPEAGDSRLGKTRLQRPAKHQLGFEHLLLQPLRHRVAVG